MLGASCDYDSRMLHAIEMHHKETYYRIIRSTASNPPPFIMDPEAVLNLFDSSWYFHLGISETQTTTLNSSSISQSQPNLPCPPLPPQNPTTKSVSNKCNNRYPSLTIHTRSKSEHLHRANSTSDISSPNSVLKPHLQKIMSGREFTSEAPKVRRPINNNNGLLLLNNKKKKVLSKSLSELEFEEVKGFMDLGFVFSEDDKDSKLVEIIPGLQRLGHKEEEDFGPRARPYLSEAWAAFEEKSPLINWTVPQVRNEIVMKDNLKWWAHSVASAVR